MSVLKEEYSIDDFDEADFLRFWHALSAHLKMPQSIDN